MRRGFYGTYHKMSDKHLSRYIGEFAGRHNARASDTLEQMALMAHGDARQAVAVSGVDRGLTSDAQVCDL